MTPTPWKWKKNKQQKSEMVEVYAPFNGGFTRIKYAEMEIKHYVAKVVIVCYCILVFSIISSLPSQVR